MHGAPKEARSRKEEARSCCSSVLRDQIQTLLPKVVIALGVHATKSLFQIGLLQKPWDKIRRDFSTGVYRESRSWFGFKTSIYCTYHTGNKAVNIHAPKLYTPRTEELLSQRIEQLEDQAAVHDFLKKNPIDATNGRGMRVLLLHWLDIGEAIRSAHTV